MFTLATNVVLDSTPSIRAYRKRRITLLPLKSIFVANVMNPFGRRLFQLPHKIAESMGRLEADKQMDVIFDTSYSLGDSIETSKVPPMYS